VLPAIEYLDFAWRFYGSVRFDLATSGMAGVDPEFFGAPQPVHDLSARARYVDALSRRYDVPPSQIVTALGASGALFVAAATLLDDKSRWLVESPSYEPLWRSADVLGAAVDRFERRYEDGFRIDPDAVLRSLRPETRVVAITNPHNPTAVWLDDDELRRIAEPLAARDVFLLVDEVYSELGNPRKTARTVGENVIACSSATKCWGVNWARAGWIFLPEVLVAPALRVERYVAGLTPPASFAYGHAAVSSADRLLERAREIQSGKRARVDRFVESMSADFEWVPPPPSALFGWLRHKRGADIYATLERGILEDGVLVAPGRFFGDPSAFRLGWTASRELIEAGLPVLERVLRGRA